MHQLLEKRLTSHKERDVSWVSATWKPPCQQPPNKTYLVSSVLITHNVVPLTIIGRLILVLSFGRRIKTNECNVFNFTYILKQGVWYNEKRRKSKIKRWISHVKLIPREPIEWRDYSHALTKVFQSSIIFHKKFPFSSDKKIAHSANSFLLVPHAKFQKFSLAAIGNSRISQFIKPLSPSVNLDV